MVINTEKEWLDFSMKVRVRDDNLCCNCRRHSKDVRISVYPKNENINLKSFVLDDYESLCSACVVIKKLYKK